MPVCASPNGCFKCESSGELECLNVSVIPITICCKECQFLTSQSKGMAGSRSEKSLSLLETLPMRGDYTGRNGLMICLDRKLLQMF